MRVSLWLMLAAVLASGCSDKDDTIDDTSADTGGDTDTTPALAFEDFINVTDAPVGELSCYDGGTWIQESAASDCKITATIGDGTVEDFATGDPVADATVSLYYGDAVSGSASANLSSDSDGKLSGALQVCTPMAVKVTTSTGDTVDSYEFHTVWGYGAEVNPDLISVDQSSWKTIPPLFGAALDDDNGVIAGSAWDCDYNEIQNAQVVLKDANGNLPATLFIGYTLNGIPSRSATATTTDGVWIAMNVPPGQWTAELYVADGAGGQRLIGSAPVEAYAHSVSIASVHAGRTTGYNLPDSCLSCAAR